MKMLPLYTLAATLAFAPMAYAQGTTVATVNIQQVMGNSKAGKSVHDQLEKKQKDFQAEIAKKEEQLQKEDQELAKQQGVLAKAAFEEKVRAFRSKATDVQKEVQSKKALLDGAFERALAEIQKAVNEVIVDLAKEKGFAVAIPTSQILYGDPKLDVSEEVLKRLDDKLPKVEVKFDAPKKAEKK